MDNRSLGVMRIIQTEVVSMWRQRILWLCALCMCATLGWGRDIADTQNLIIGSWYCASSDVFHRFDFRGDGGFMWSSYIPLKGNLRFGPPIMLVRQLMS